MAAAVDALGLACDASLLAAFGCSLEAAVAVVVAAFGSAGLLWAAAAALGSAGLPVVGAGLVAGAVVLAGAGAGVGVVLGFSAMFKVG